MDDIMEIILETGEAHLNDVVDIFGFSEDVVRGEAPVILPYNEKFYKSTMSYVIFAGDFIMYVEGCKEVNADEYLDLYNEINMATSSVSVN